MAKKAKRTKPITAAVASRVLQVVDKGLSDGLGEDTQTPGKMCVEAAVCYAMGEPHSDRPLCVMEGIRDVKIKINDHDIWKEAGDDIHDKYDPKAARIRSRALRRLAIAQLGSKGKITFEKWEKAVSVYLHEKLNNSPEKVTERKTGIKILEQALKDLKAGKSVNVSFDYDPEDCNYEIDILDALDIKTVKDAKKVCEDIVQILIKLKSPGTKFLYLTEKGKAKAKAKKRVVKKSKAKRKK